ncbi:hypothetical protein GIB67_029096 [Kingdonia uniflora]|uniref:Uncharacterized protein n=1 Tax=Kingdonia uniflora TaxID=39325 RepID=A0A7J7N6R1_9MAGN|nr:hypothetical protein GIB67_029096 [Kingdonia uniflora]
MFSSYLGILAATLGLVYIQENLGWELGYGIPTVGLALSLFIFYLGTPYYRHKVRNTKSPAKDLICVPIAAIKHRKLALPSDPSELHELEPQHYNTKKRQVLHTPTFRCAPSNYDCNLIDTSHSRFEIFVKRDLLSPKTFGNKILSSVVERKKLSTPF